MADTLTTYRSKRDFEATPEPPPESAEGRSAAPRFVIQEHHARRLHWDLRLERDGVLISWAVPKGIPLDPKQNNLAVHTEDHPLSYIDFEGEIPAGNYGAGKVKLWDRGTYEPHKFRRDEVIVTFHGERVTGRYALFQTRGDDWMIHRMDPPVDPHRESMPERLRPMLARAGPLPSDDAAYGFEIKWDGIRALYFSDRGRARIQGRNLNDITTRYPELRELGRELGARQAVIDGEIVAFDDEGRPSFGRLQQRMHVSSEAAARRRARELPVVYAIFDVLFLDGRYVTALPYAERRALLEELELEGSSWRTPAYHRGDGKAILEATRERGLEGVVAKRLDSPYDRGRRSGAWIKVKNARRLEVVIGGWMPGEGNRRGRIGALLAGVYERSGDAGEEEPALRYVGRIGTGFTEATLDALASELEPLRRERSPFAVGSPGKGAVYVEPELVAEVEYSEWTGGRILRHPAFKGLRRETRPRDVVVELPDG